MFNNGESLYKSWYINSNKIIFYNDDLKTLYQMGIYKIPLSGSKQMNMSNFIESKRKRNGGKQMMV